MKRQKQNDQGIAMVSLLAITAILTTLSVATFTLSTYGNNRSALSQARGTGIAAAESGIDHAMSMLGATPLPCTASGTLQSAPHTSSYTVTMTYYATFPISGSALVCTPGVGPSAVPAAVQLESLGSTSGNELTRRMQALVRLTATPTGSMDKALFSESGFAPNNNITMYGYVGNDADIYTNGNFSCQSSQTIQGSVFAQGTLTASNNCTVAVDYFARGNVNLSNNVTVNHDAKSSRGNISMSGNARVNHDAIAAGSNTGGTVVNSRVSNAILNDPPSQVFPTIEWDAAAWSAAGWTRQIDHGSDCTAAKNEIAAMSSQSTPTVVRTTCALTWTGNNTIQLAADLAVFSTGGFTMQNNFTAQSTNSTVRKFYMVVPTSAATPDCTSPGITFQNNTTFASTINTMLYTPCRVSIENNDGGYGQIYANNVAVSNSFDFHYRPATVPGVSWNGSSSNTFTRDLIYKRETAA